MIKRLSGGRRNGYSVLHDFFTGYEQAPNILTRRLRCFQSFAGTFTDALKGKELATAQINQGADIISECGQYHGHRGYGSASELNVYAIGVDTNQDSLYPGHILTSMQKRVDICTFQMIESVVNGTYEGGSITYMDASGPRWCWPD